MIIALSLLFGVVVSAPVGLFNWMLISQTIAVLDAGSKVLQRRR